MKNEATAYHEAGHTIALWRLEQRPARCVSIEPDEDSLGGMLDPDALRGIVGLDSGDLPPRVQRRAENLMVILLAGRAAQRRHNPQSVRLHHSASDREKVCTILSFLCGPSSDVVRAYYKLMDLRARSLVQDRTNWQAIEILAQELLRRRTLSREELREFIVSKCFALRPAELKE
jgi:hypothetical protein